jgi:hypothetical protein
MDEKETHFREVFLFGVLQARGVCKAERPRAGTSRRQQHSLKKHTR